MLGKTCDGRVRNQWFTKTKKPIESLIGLIRLKSNKECRLRLLQRISQILALHMGIFCTIRNIQFIFMKQKSLRSSSYLQGHTF